MMEQPRPTGGGDPVLPSLVAQLETRRALGRVRYGTELTTANGRNPYRDMLDELLDALQYLEQARMEHVALVAAVLDYQWAHDTYCRNGCLSQDDEVATVAREKLFALVKEVHP
jgi:hypothetical protein